MDAAVAVYLELLESAFRRPPGPDGDSHSLLGNLHTVEAGHWDARPAGGVRTVRDIVLHVGSSKFMYADHAFGNASYSWAAPPAWPEDWATMPPAALLEWLADGHELLREAASALDADGLESPRRTPWGEPWPARRIIESMIAHDHYHAGEINHIRALLSGNDAWAYAV